MVTGKEGTVSTASLYCRYHVQRLQEQGNNAPRFSESFGLDPRTLRPERLRWLKCLTEVTQNKSEAEAKIAAFSVSEFWDCLVGQVFFLRSPCLKKRGPRFRGNDGREENENNQSFKSHFAAKALSHRASTLHPISTYGLEAGAETSPPFFLQQQRAPP